MHEEASQIDQIDCFGVSLDEERERLGVETGQGCEIRALDLVGRGAFDLDQCLVDPIDQAYPRHTPTSD